MSIADAGIATDTIPAKAEPLPRSWRRGLKTDSASGLILVSPTLLYALLLLAAPLLTVVVISF